jgi:predicted NUDIX family phosphoesterase
MEQVLCIPRTRLPENWVAGQSVVPLCFDDFVGQCTNNGFLFKNRSQVEEDPSYKQVIPYILLQTWDQGMTAVYCRKGGEKRLHDLWSAGIGGHVNPVDQGLETDFEQIILAGMQRELDEELILRPETDQAEFLGIINEESSPVSAVHIGAVFRIQTRTPEQYTPGPELHRFQWITSLNLDRLSLELWSNLALDLSENR